MSWVPCSIIQKVSFSVGPESQWANMGSLTTPPLKVLAVQSCAWQWGSGVSQTSSNLPSSLWQSWIAFLTYTLPSTALAVISPYGKGRCLTGMPMEKTFTMQRKTLASSNRKLGERALRGLNRERQQHGHRRQFKTNLLATSHMTGEYYITLSFSMMCLNGSNAWDLGE